MSLIYKDQLQWKIKSTWAHVDKNKNPYCPIIWHWLSFCLYKFFWLISLPLPPFFFILMKCYLFIANANFEARAKNLGNCSDRALEKENYVCFRCFQKLLFKGSENYDISPKETRPPLRVSKGHRQSRCLQSWAKWWQVCVWGKGIRERMRWKGILDRKPQRTSIGVKCSPMAHGNLILLLIVNVGDAQRRPDDVSLSPPKKSSF